MIKVKKMEFKMIYTDDMSKLVKVYRQFQVNYKRGKEYKTKIENGKDNTANVIHNRDPLSSIIIDFSNRNKL